MLSEKERTLIFTAIDGELSPAEIEQFRTLMAESADALRFHQVALHQSQQLQSLPIQPAPVSLAVEIQRAIRAGRGTGRAAVVETGTVRLRHVKLLPYVIAASILLLVVSASFWAASEKSETRPQDLAIQLPTPHPKTDGTTEQARATPLLPLLGDGTTEQPGFVLPDEIARMPAEPDFLPQPRLATTVLPTMPSVFGAKPLPPMAALTEVQLRLPTLIAVPRLQDSEALTQVSKLWETPQTVKLELFVRDTSKAVETLKAGFAPFHIQIVVDESTQERMKRSPLLPCVLFCDLLSADELRGYLSWLGKRTESEGFPSGTMLHAQSTGPNDAKDIREFFGSDLGWPARRKVLDAKPVAQATIEELEQQLQAKKRIAMVVTFLPAQARILQANAPEVKQFVALHEDRKPGQIGVLLVIRPAS